MLSPGWDKTNLLELAPYQQRQADMMAMYSGVPESLSHPPEEENAR